MDDKQKNIGLVTWFGTPNYGTNLQAFALYKVLEERGFNVRLIKRFKTPFTLKNIKDNYFYAHGIRRFWKYKHSSHFPAKTRLIRHFCRDEMKTALVYTRRNLDRLLKETDIFVAGSDQLWNCHDHFRGFEFLDFAAGKKKISYGTSIGTVDIPADCRKKIKEYLTDFKYISLREQSGASSIAAVTGRTDIETVLDPVLLCEKSFWEKEAAKAEESFLHPLCSVEMTESKSGETAERTDIRPNELTEKKSNEDRLGGEPGYILYYILRKGASGSAPMEEVEKYLTNHHEKGLKKIIIPSGENPGFSLPGAKVIKDAGIREFIALVKGASLVVTDSYHGTALSIVLERQFINLKRFSDNDIASQNIRIKDLLDRLGIDNRTLHGRIPEPDRNDEATILHEGSLPDIDYSIVSPKLESLRAQSNLYLDKALADED